MESITVGHLWAEREIRRIARVEPIYDLRQCSTDECSQHKKARAKPLSAMETNI